MSAAWATVPGMSEIADRHRRLAARFTARVEAVPPDRWESPSPCEGWTARDVVAHVAGNAAMFLGLIGRDPPAGPPAERDPLGAWVTGRDATQAALEDPAVATTEYDGLRGRMTFEQGIDQFACFDLVVHAWDLARATGQDDRLDPEEVSRVFAAARSMGDALRGPGAFGPAVEPPPGADEQAQFLAFLGRRPDRAP